MVWAAFCSATLGTSPAHLLNIPYKCSAMNGSMEKPLKLRLHENYRKKNKQRQLICRVTIIFGFPREELCDSLMVNTALPGKSFLS